MKVKHFSTSPRPKIALITATNSLCDTKACNVLFGVNMRVFSYNTEEEYEIENQRAVDWQPDAMIGGEKAVRMARKYGIDYQFLDANEESLAEAVRTAETAFYANEQNSRMNAQLDAMLNGQSNGILELDIAGRILRTNSIMAELLNVSEASLAGRNISEIFPTITQERISDLLTRRESYSIFLHIRYQAVVVILTPICQTDGRPESVMVSCYRVHRSFQIETDSEERLLAGGDADSGDLFEKIHHKSPRMAQTVEWAKKFSNSSRPVLIVGENSI